MTKNQITSPAQSIRVASLASNRSIFANFALYESKKPEDEQMTISELVDYINDHAASDSDSAVYTGTYAKYNDGNLYGMWIDVASFDTYQEFTEFINALHSDEADPEPMHQDYQNFPSSLYCECGGEEMFDAVKKFAEIDNSEALETFLDNGLGSIEDFEDAYVGEYDSEEDFAYNYIQEYHSFEMNDFALQYFNYESFARDLFMEEYYFDNGFVFRR